MVKAHPTLPTNLNPEDTPIVRSAIAQKRALPPMAQPAMPPKNTPQTQKIKGVLETLEDHKGQDITVLDIAKHSGFTDAMVIVTGTSTRHIASMAQALAEHHKPHLLGQEGAGTEWVCTDLGSVVVHIFTAEKRALYNLEKLWSYQFPE